MKEFAFRTLHGIHKHRSTGNTEGMSRYVQEWGTGWATPLEGVREGSGKLLEVLASDGDVDRGRGRCQVGTEKCQCQEFQQEELKEIYKPIRFRGVCLSISLRICCEGGENGRSWGSRGRQEPDHGKLRLLWSGV